MFLGFWFQDDICHLQTGSNGLTMTNHQALSRVLSQQGEVSRWVGVPSYGVSGGPAISPLSSVKLSPTISTLIWFLLVCGRKIKVKEFHVSWNMKYETALVWLLDGRLVEITVVGITGTSAERLLLSVQRYVALSRFLHWTSTCKKNANMFSLAREQKLATNRQRQAFCRLCNT